MTSAGPPVLCIVGRKNAGKTGLTVALAAELNRRGYRVMTVKHGHGFWIDSPGKDSWRHRHEGGALRTVMAGPRDFAVVGGWPHEEMSLEEVVQRFLWDADIVLAEGFKSMPEPKIEVFRKGTHPVPLFDPGDPAWTRTLALVTDATDLKVSIPVFPLNDPELAGLLSDLVETSFRLRRSGS
ncbi:MAG: molybdopterin-guanine dinucleotide biosynthesis protein B [Longimicrobiales bacterium]